MKEIKDYSLLPHNTFGMDVKASLFVEYESVTELQSILSDKKLMAGNWLHIGGGSNLLFKGDYAGTVLHSAIRGYEVVAENEQEIEVRAGAGEVWDDFVAYTVKNSWYGAENLSLIPGVQVAGAVGFGKVDGKNIRICVENRLTLVPGHVKPCGVAGLEQLQSMEQRRRRERHQAVDLSVIGTVAVRRSRSAVVHNTVDSLLL